MKPHHRKKLLRLLLGATALALAVWYLLPHAFPLPNSLTETPRSPIILDRHGALLHHLTLPDFTRSQPVPLTEIPSDLIACTLAAEDKRFLTHGGIDLLATARAAKDRLAKGRITSGASTITQQLIKISSPKSPRTLKTKLREALTARHLEMTWTKDQILEAYLNRLDYGHNRLGPTEAARYYFQKPLTDLSLAECALLAGLPQSPSRLNPTRHPDRALTRRTTVLTRLASNGKYDKSRISTAKAEPLTLRPLKRITTAPWLTSFPDLRPSTPDLQTTLDARLQRQLETIVTEELAPLADKNLHHAAVVVIHNPTGEILALVSSGNWNDPRGGQINGALAPRSPGSALKPFTYLLSFEQAGRFPGSIVADIPTRFRTREGLDLPENFDRHFRGPVTIRQALACSLNIPAMRELNDLGGPEPLHSFLQQLGITTLDPDPIPYGLGLTLGNAPVNLLELTNAYATLARGGGFHPPSLFKHPSSPIPHRCFSQESAYLIADILSDPAARAPAFSRHGPLELPFRCAAKTGTSSDFRDNWCLGFTPEFTVGVWAGNFDNSPMKGLSGVAGAGPIFRRTMIAAHQNHEPTWFKQPDSLAQIRIDPRTGKSIKQWHDRPGHEPKRPEHKNESVPPKFARPSMTETVMPRTYTTQELCPSDSLPLPASNTDYSPQGFALLDQSYSEWLDSSHNQRRDEFLLAPDQPAISPLRILAPRPDATYILDPELPNGGRLHLATNLPGLATWKCDTLTLSPSDSEPIATLTPGIHTLTATDPRSGESILVTLKVESR
ncbi:penicillin-binding protein 1C [Haloferula sp.]|uniref:penicillin-binding protein 1C n=1 Tax=Haloferula sp. TaxID=2497595 RepID=UPI003C73368A